MTRIFHPAALESGKILALDERACHHLINALRAKTQDPVILFNGEGGEYHAVIVRIEKQTIWVELHDFNAVDRESPLHIHLGQGISRGEKMDFTIQKAVELGVTDITPLITERCGVQLSQERWKKRLEHWQKIIISACEQSGRNKLPQLHAVSSLPAWTQRASPSVKIVLHPLASHTLKQTSLASGVGIDLLVGPEGGLSEAEVEFAVQQQFSKINLGPRVLRTETAALAMIASLQSLYGDFC